MSSASGIAARLSGVALLGSGVMEVRSGTYQLIECLGRGSSAKIWRAAAPDGDSPVAVKVFHDATGDNATTYRREAQAAAAMARSLTPAGPGFEVAYARCAVLVQTADGLRPALVLPFIDGRPLGDWLAGGPSPEDRHRVAAGLLSAIDWVHAAGVAHGDLSLGNVLVTDGGDPSLIDFGLAAPLAPGESWTGEIWREPLRPIGLFNDSRQKPGVARDLRAFAIVCALVIAGVHPFAVDSQALFAGARKVRLDGVPRSIAPSQFVDSAEAERLDAWLGPALRVEKGLSARSMLDTIPF